MLISCIVLSTLFKSFSLWAWSYVVVEDQSKVALHLHQSDTTQQMLLLNNHTVRNIESALFSHPVHTFHNWSRLNKLLMPFVQHLLKPALRCPDFCQFELTQKLPISTAFCWKVKPIQETKSGSRSSAISVTDK